MADVLPTPPPTTGQPVGPKRFTIALSYPGEHRARVEPIAHRLAACFDQDRVLYDKFHDAEFARLDLNTYLPALYRKESELIVIFLCPQYAAKLWCRLEWRHISQLIATLDAQRVMFLSFGDPGDLSDLGILGGDGYIDILAFTPELAAEKILKRLKINQGITSPKPPPTIAPTAPARIDISRIIRYAPAELIGRDAEKKLLSAAWAKTLRGEAGRPTVMTFVALGGEGKTSLVAKWVVDEMNAKGWPGCDAAFAWSFYSQGTREQQAASSDLFLKEALTFFGDDADKAFAASPAGAFEKGQRLARLVGQRRSLLILDGLEPLQHAPSSTAFEQGKLKDQGIAALLKGLATASHGLCIVTTRCPIHELRGVPTAPEVKLLRLPTEAGVALLSSLKLERDGEILRLSGAQIDFEALVEDVNGHALTLTIFGSYLLRAFRGDIRQRDRVKFEKADEKMDGGHAFRTMAAYEQWLLRDGGDEGRREVAVLRLMGLFDRPADAGCLHALLQPPAILGLTEPLMGLDKADFEYCLTGLETARLLTVNRDATRAVISLDAHPLVRKYFAAQSRAGSFWTTSIRRLLHCVFSQIAVTSPSWRAAHRRLYEHLCASTQDKPQPTLEDLQPLFEAVIHGCEAGLHDQTFITAYWRRIVREQRNHHDRPVGATSEVLSILQMFFEEPWSRPSGQLANATRLHVMEEAGTYLFVLGNLQEGARVLDACAREKRMAKDWVGAAKCLRLAREAYLLLGRLHDAKKRALDAIQLVDQDHTKSGLIEQLIARSAYAQVLHYLEPSGDIEFWFEKAIKIQRQLDGDDAELYGASGVWYCDWLLDKDRFEDADRVAAYMIRAAGQNRWLMEIALNHHSLVHLLHRTKARSSSTVGDLIKKAVDEIRCTGQQHHLVKTLITRAWLRCEDGERLGAQADLDEAWEIAKRGPMKLYMADIQLLRARYFACILPYPWNEESATGGWGAKDDLAAADKIITECCYHRRDRDLAHAKKQLGQ